MNSIRSLYDNIQQYIIKDEFKNSKFKRELKKCLINKGLNPSIFTLLTNGNLTLDKLDSNELICITDTYYQLYNKDTGENKDEEKRERAEFFKVENYFSDSERISYANLVPKVESEKRMRFENINVNPNIMGNFIGFVKIETMAKYYLDRNIIYDFDSQRQAVYKKVHGITVREPFLNPVSVNDMAEEMMKGDFIKNSTITLNIQALDNKTPNVWYDEKTRVLEIEPLLDYNSPNTTVVSCSDGYHTLNAAVKYINECRQNDIEPQGYLLVQFVQFTKERARKFIVEQSKANPIGKVYAESIAPGEYDEVIAEMNRCLDEKRNIFYNNIESTNSLKRSSGKLISKVDLEVLLENINLEIANSILIRTVVPKLCRIVTDLYNGGINEIDKALKFANELKELDIDSEEYLVKATMILEENK